MTRRRCRRRAARFRAEGEKKPRSGTPASAFSWVARVEKKSAGGGRSIPIDFASVERKTVSSTVGKRCGSSRSVSERIPTGTPGSRARSCSASAWTRSSRVGEPERDEASIDRETSATTNTSASVRSSIVRVVSTIGCIAASPSRHGTAASAAASGASDRSGGWARPRLLRTLRARRSRRTSTASGTTSVRASTAPSGVRKRTSTAQ